MEILTTAEVKLRFEELIEKIKKGSVFIHPSDTIYGLGCNALDVKAVDKIRKLKERPDSPFSIWVPSLDWIEENCKLTKKSGEWLSKLPGAYTLIVPLKNKEAIAKNVSPNVKTIGIRYPDHWFGRFVELLGMPIVTTSVNKAGEPFMTSIENLDVDIAKGVDFLVYGGEMKSRPSKIINIEKEEVKER